MANSRNTQSLVQVFTGPELTTEIDYNGGSNATYVGTALPGTATSAAGWTIKFLTYDSNNNVLSVTWGNVESATGLPSPGLIWANRASYSYS